MHRLRSLHHKAPQRLCTRNLSPGPFVHQCMCAPMCPCALCTIACGLPLFKWPYLDVAAGEGDAAQVHVVPATIHLPMWGSTAVIFGVPAPAGRAVQESR